MTDSASITQHTARQVPQANLELTPPLAEEFSPYGGPDTVARARRWALDRRYLLADGVPTCAHGLYLMPKLPRTGNLPQSLPPA